MWFRVLEKEGFLQVWLAVHLQICVLGASTVTVVGRDWGAFTELCVGPSIRKERCAAGQERIGNDVLGTQYNK
mgnify:CR=1 FL=1